VPDSGPIEGAVSFEPFAGGDGRRFDVFLSHNNRDKHMVERIAERLKRARLEPWLDAWHLVAGMDWQRGLAEGLAASRSCAVFVGPADLGAWENQEVAVALDRAATDPEFRLFLVLLPGVPERFDAAGLSPFLRMRTWVDYRRGFDDERAFQGLVSAVNGVPLGPEVPIEPDAELCPYRGLEVFEEEHAEFFFGRDADVQRLFEKLKATRFLAVLGASGSGKSSLVRAGLVPALRRAALPGEERCEIAILRPGAHPLEALAAQLLRLGADGAMQQTLDGLAADLRTFHLASSLVLAEYPPGTRLLLVVDQFEEVFTLCRDEQQRTTFFANLLYAATIPEGRCGVLVVMRADFYHRCGVYPELAQQLAAEQYLVSPLQPEGLRQAVEEPARRVGLAFEPGLVATILDDVADQPGALPLLEHALLEVWRRRTGGMLTLAGYRESGGVQGAIAKHAEEVFASLEPGQQELARRTFLRLTQPGEGTEDTRRRAHPSELAGNADDDVGPVLARLVDARLVTTSREESAGGEVVEVAHEALIRGWPRLRGWIDEDRAGLRVHRRLTEAAREWERLGRDGSALYRGARLAEALEWREANEQSVNNLEREFLAASRRVEQDELEQVRRRTRRLRALALALAVFLAAAIGAAVLAKRQTNEANAQKRVASSRALASTALALASASDAQRDSRSDVSLVLSFAAYRLVPSAEARGSLIAALADARRWGNVTLRGQGFVQAVALSADAQTLLILSDGTVRLSDVRAGKQLGTPLSSHCGPVSCVALSADGRTLAIGEGDGTVRLWDVRAGKQLGAPLHIHSSAVQTVALSADGRTLASAGRDGTVRLWDLPAHKPLGPPIDNVSDWSPIALSADGRTLAFGSPEFTVRLWDVRSRKPLWGPLRGHSGTVRSVALSADGRTLASGSFDSTVRLWDVRARKALGAPFTNADATVESVALSGDGRTVAAGTLEAVRVWDVRTRKRLLWARLDAASDTTSIALSADVRTLATGDVNGTVRLLDVVRKPLGVPLRDRTGPIWSVALSADGRTLASAGRDGTVRLWDPRARKQLRPPPRSQTGTVHSVALSADGQTLVTGHEDGTVWLWDVRSRKPLWGPLRGHSGTVRSVALSADGRTLASVSFDSTVRLWDVRARKPIASPPYGAQPVGSMALSADGRTLVIRSRGRVLLWDIRGRKELASFDASANQRVAVSADGRLVAAFGDDGVVLWDARGGMRAAFGRGSGSFLSGAFSADASTLVTGNEDGTVRLWDVPAHKPLGRPLLGHSGGVASLALSADGRTLASGGKDGTLRLWEDMFWSDFDDLKTRVCALVAGLGSADWSEFAPGIPYQPVCGVREHSLGTPHGALQHYEHPSLLGMLL
jgi:WD40 repeat protein